MTAPDFRGPRLEIKRAEHHIRHLEEIFSKFVRDKTQRAARQKMGNPNRRAAQIGLRFPEEIPAILGDAIHNMHAALDHAYCVLVMQHSGWLADMTRFPFGGDKQWELSG